MSEGCGSGAGAGASLTVGGARRAGAELALGAIDRSDPPASLYIHVPFCFHKCHYCDFYSLVDRSDRQAAFTDRLVRELEAMSALAGGPRLRTIFVGGGTPTLLRAELWERVLVALGACFDLAEILAGRGEFTVECNPETASGELFGVLAGGGVDRISMGAQSFDPRHLKTLERWHDPESVSRAIGLARAAGFRRLSLDLIYAIPGQSVEDVGADVARALSLGVEHLSAYNLTYEPRTTMTSRLRAGEFEAADEGVEVEMFELVGELCRGAGLDRYEVSNFARAGQESLHNLAYWRCEQWLAAGPSASGHVGGHRYTNVRAIDEYLRPSGSGLCPSSEHEAPDGRRDLAERIMMGLRVREGLDEGAVLRAAAAIDDGAAGRLAGRVRELIDEGLLERTGAEPEARLRVTSRGWLMVDGMAARLMRVLG